MKYIVTALAAIALCGLGTSAFGQNRAPEVGAPDSVSADNPGSKMTDRERTEIRERWNKWDADSDGKITAEEFEAANDPDAKWSDYDFDKDGEITEDEWERASTSGTTGVRETEDKSQQDR